MMSSVHEIITRRCLLASISKDEAGMLGEIFDDVQTRRFLPELYEMLDSPDGLLNFVSAFECYAMNSKGYLWGIRLNDKLAGFVAVMDLADTPLLFYAMHPDFRSCGYMKEAICGVLDYLGNEKGIRTISTDVYKENCISAAILQQSGFCVSREDEQKVYMTRTM